MADKDVLCEVVDLGRTLTVAQVSNLKQQLLPLFSSQDAIRVDAGSVERIDAAGLQLIYGFTLQCQQRQQPYSFVSISHNFEAACRVSGVPLTPSSAQE